MLSDESHGFPLREHAIKSEKENILKYEKYMNVKISKRQVFSFLILPFPFTLNKNLHPSLQRKKKRSHQV